MSERAEHEIPGSVLDWDDIASWGDCACPSMEALDALDVAPDGAELVWLKEPPQAPTEDDYYNQVEFEPCEAIVIRRYLGSRYDLVKII